MEDLFGCGDLSKMRFSPLWSEQFHIQKTLQDFTFSAEWRQSVDYEREKGRVLGLRTKRLKAIEFAKMMVPVFATARADIGQRHGEGPSMLALSKWLNQRDYRTIRGKTWRAQTVSRVFDCCISGIEEIENEYNALWEIRDTLIRNPDFLNREERLEEIGDIEARREQGITELRKLSAALHGKAYIEAPVPPPMRMPRQHSHR